MKGAALAGAIVASLIVLFVQGLLVMICLGFLHEAHEAIPALDYVASLWVALLAKVLLFGAFARD